MTTYPVASSPSLVQQTESLAAQLEFTQSSHTNLTHCFLATDVECVADLKLDITEQIDVVLLPLERLIKNIDNGILLQTLHISSLFFALRKLDKVQFS